MSVNEASGVVTRGKRKQQSDAEPINLTAEQPTLVFNAFPPGFDVKQYFVGKGDMNWAGQRDSFFRSLAEGDRRLTLMKLTLPLDPTSHLASFDRCSFRSCPSPELLEGQWVLFVDPPQPDDDPQRYDIIHADCLHLLVSATGLGLGVFNGTAVQRSAPWVDATRHDSVGKVVAVFVAYWQAVTRCDARVVKPDTVYGPAALDGKPIVVGNNAFFTSQQDKDEANILRLKPDLVRLKTLSQVTELAEDPKYQERWEKNTVKANKIKVEDAEEHVPAQEEPALKKNRRALYQKDMPGFTKRIRQSSNGNVGRNNKEDINKQEAHNTQEQISKKPIENTIASRNDNNPKAVPLFGAINFTTLPLSRATSSKTIPPSVAAGSATAPLSGAISAASTNNANAAQLPRQLTAVFDLVYEELGSSRADNDRNRARVHRLADDLAAEHRDHADEIWNINRARSEKAEKKIRNSVQDFTMNGYRGS